MKFITGNSSELKPQLMAKVANYRHKIFVEKLGWQLQCESAFEYDQFDRDDTIYIVAQNESNGVIGTARLLPTTGPYLLGEVFPQLLHGRKPPASDEVWEHSRFAAVDFNASSTSAVQQFSAPVSHGLLRSAIRCSASKGAKKLVLVSTLAVERLMLRHGFQAHRMAPPIIVDGSPIVACELPTNQA